MTRQERVQAAIDRGDVVELLALVEWQPCACKGARDGESLCSCKMSAKQVRDAVSYAALKHGKLIRL